MFYTNRSAVTKTFHGVTFRPGETKEVFGTINDPKMSLSSTRKEPPKRGRRSTPKVDASAKVVSEPKIVEATDVLKEADESTKDAPVLEPSENVENKEV